MRGNIALIIILIILVSKSTAQVNLVPNPSFEDTTQCPFLPGQIYYSSPWTDPNNGSSDLYNSCASSMYVGVPINIGGIQAPRTGNAYAGLMNWAQGTNLREYIMIQLDSQLTNNKVYLVTFFVSMADTQTVACNNFGAYFSDTALFGPTGIIFNVIPQISNSVISNPLTDKINWVKILGTFVANGNERYLIIGNFLNDANSDTVYVGGGCCDASYYYIDDVSVICTDCDTGIGINEKNISTEFNIYPNPVTDRLFIDCNFKEKEFVITDLIGNEITRVILENGKAQVDLSEFKNGIYFIKSQDEAKKFVVLR